MKNELLIFSGILGASLGSFLNVVAHRSIMGRSWFGASRSECEACHKILKWYELIPIISYLIQFGRCRNCHEKISIRYLLVEIIGLCAGIIIYLKFKISFEYFIALIGFSSFLLNSLTDIETGDVFDLYALTPGVTCLIIKLFLGLNIFLDGVYGMCAGFLIFALIILLTRGGMGWGDATFMAGAGGVLGLKFILLGFYLGIMLGGFCVIILLLIGKIHLGRGEKIFLVPFLAIGNFTAMIYGNEILKFLGYDVLIQMI